MLRNSATSALTNPMNQCYEFEILNTESPKLGLRFSGELEFVCDEFDELDQFVKSRAVNVELEVALAGFLRNAYDANYVQAAHHLAAVYACGYFLRFVMAPGAPATLIIAQGDGDGWEGLFHSLPALDPMVFGADLGRVLRACIFSCVPYQFEIHNSGSPVLGVQIYGGDLLTCDTFHDLDRVFSQNGVKPELEAALAGIIQAANALNYVSAADHLATVYACGYSLQLEAVADMPIALRVIKGDGGGREKLSQLLSALKKPAGAGSYLDNLVQVMQFASKRPTLTNPSSEIYEFALTNTIQPRFAPAQPFFDVIIAEDRLFTCSSFNKLDAFFKQRSINVELERALAGFMRCVYLENYEEASRMLSEVVNYGYTFKFQLNADEPTVFRVAPGDGTGRGGLLSALPVYDKANIDGDIEKLYRACAFYSTPYEVGIYNLDSPLLQNKAFKILTRIKAFRKILTIKRLRNHPLVYKIRNVLKTADIYDGFYSNNGAKTEVNQALSGFVRAAYEMNYMLASHHLAIIYRHDYYVRLHVPQNEVAKFCLSRGDGGGWEGLSQHLLDHDLSLFSHDMTNFLTSCIVGCMHGLYGSEHPEKAREMATEFFTKGSRNHVIEDILIAQGSYSNNMENAHPLAKSLATGNEDYLEFFKGKTCNHPVSDFEIGTEGRVFVCCPSYLPQSIGNVFTAGSIDEVIQSKHAKLIRDSINKQDFRFCRWLHCKEIDSLPSVSSSKVKKDIYPVDFRLSFDTTCNLWCVTCRNEKITVRGEQREIMLRATQDIIIPMLKKARSVTMNGYGDVFASKPCRQVLHSVNSKDNPDLKINFITNAVLLTEQEWNNFENIHDMMGDVRISIDAATKETYDKIRLGGDWDVLMENLKFIAGLRDKGVIKSLSICYVYQRENFREMAEFARMGKELGCDLVIFDALLNWNTYEHGELNDRSVHHTSNALHGEFLEELKRLREVLPPSTPHVTWQQEHSGKRTTLLSIDSRF